MEDKSNWVNMPTTIKDPLYRYKMPPMKLKIEGRGNGIKTNIVNLSVVAQELEVQADCTLILIYRYP